MDIKRHIAFKVRIKDISDGNYIKQDGTKSNYVLFKDGRKISRVNVIAVILSKVDDKELNYRSIIIDDGSGKIAVRSFDDLNIFDGVSIGDSILAIGKIREFGGEKYIIPEIIKKIDDKRWITLRKIELGINDKESEEVKKEKAVDLNENKISNEANKDVEDVVEFIKRNDSGNGVSIQDVVNNFGDESERIIKNLLENGDIFELKPGFIKVLE